MWPKLDYQLKIDYYNCKMFYINLRVLTKQKPTVNRQKIKEKGIMEYHQEKSYHKDSKRRKEQRNYKTSRKQDGNSFYLSKITLNINGLNFTNQKT